VIELSYETFSYLSDVIKPIKAFKVDYHSNMKQSEIYRLINNSLNTKPPYYIERNSIYYLEEDPENYEFIKDLKNLMVIDDPNQVALNIENEAHQIIIRSLIKESLLKFLINKRFQFKRARGNLFYKIEEFPDRIGEKSEKVNFKFNRYIVFSFDYKIIDNSLLLIIDLKHTYIYNLQNDNLNQSDLEYIKYEFKKYSSLPPNLRYEKLKNKITEIFGNINEIKFHIPGNNDLTLHRILSQ
jgi:hypothetical protein